MNDVRVGGDTSLWLVRQSGNFCFLEMDGMAEEVDNIGFEGKLSFFYTVSFIDICEFFRN